MDFIITLKMILFGIVEGITEWLPISSTGHLIIFEKWLNITQDVGASFWDFFIVIIQLGAILAVIFTFIKDLWPFGKNKTPERKKEIWKTWLFILIACVPAGIVGVLTDDLITEKLSSTLVVSITLIVYGIFFIILEYVFKKNNKTFAINDVKEFTWKTALIIGACQMLALIPGTSRSGVTILGAMIIGCNREVSAKFSFYVSIPIMFAASLYRGAKFFMNGNSLSGGEVGYIIVGCLVAFIVSLVCIKFLTSFVKKHTFIGFGYYRIALGILLLVLTLTVFKDSDVSLGAINTLQVNISPLIAKY